MSLFLKFNLILLLVFAAGLVPTGIVFGRLLEDNARQQILANAEIMMETAMAKRATDPEMPTEVALDLAEETTADLGAPVVAPLAAGVTDRQRVLVEQELIRRIGPLGKILVTRAAKTAGSPEELGRTLAANIPDGAGREAFLRFIAGLGG